MGGTLAQQAVTCETITARYPKIEATGRFVELFYRVETSIEAPAVIEVIWDYDRAESWEVPDRYPLGVAFEHEGSLTHEYPAEAEGREVRIRLDVRLDGYEGGCGKSRFVEIRPLSLTADVDPDCPGGLAIRSFDMLNSGALPGTGPRYRPAGTVINPTECEVGRAYFYLHYTPTGGDRYIIAEWSDTSYLPGEERGYPPSECWYCTVEAGPGRFTLLMEIPETGRRVWWGGGVTVP
jgi:hypothetical protein